MIESMLTAPDVKQIAKNELFGNVFCTGVVQSVEGRKATLMVADEMQESQKFYKAINGYVPVPGDRVLLGRFSGTIVILGGLSE